MVKILRCHLIRHAPADYPKGILPPEDPDAILPTNNQITQLIKKLPNNASWWLSPLRRCQQTAEALLSSELQTASIHHQPLLAEQSFGDWHGQNISEVWGELERQQKHNWSFVHPDTTPPNGESFHQVVERQLVLQKHLSEVETEDLVIVAHSGVIKAWLCIALGMSPAQALSCQINPFSLSQLSWMKEGAVIGSPEWQLLSLNVV